MSTVDGPVGRADARRNRQRILDVAVRVLTDEPTATVDDVASAAGVAARTVFRHFPTREELVRTAHVVALQQVGARLRDAVAGTRPDDRLSALVTASLSCGREYGLLSALDARTTDPSIRAELDALLSLLEDEAARARVQYGLRSDVSDRWLARVLSALVEASLDVPQGAPDEDAALTLDSFLAVGRTRPPGPIPEVAPRDHPSVHPQKRQPPPS